MAASEQQDQAESVRQRRLRQIFDAREHVRDTMLRVEEEKRLNELPPQTARLFLYRSVEGYLKETESLLRPNRQPPTDDEGNYLAERDTRELPGSTDWWWLKPVGEWPLPGGKRYRCASLNEFFSMRVPTRVTWTEQVETELGGTEMQQRSRAVSPPRHVCVDAARLVDRALADCGLEIDVVGETEVIGGAV